MHHGLPPFRRQKSGNKVPGLPIIGRDAHHAVAGAHAGMTRAMQRHQKAGPHLRVGRRESLESKRGTMRCEPRIGQRHRRAAFQRCGRFSSALFGSATFACPPPQPGSCRPLPRSAVPRRQNRSPSMACRDATGLRDRQSMATAFHRVAATRSQSSRQAIRSSPPDPPPDRFRRTYRLEVDPPGDRRPCSWQKAVHHPYQE